MRFLPSQDEFLVYSKQQMPPVSIHQQMQQQTASVQYVMQGGKLPNMFLSNTQQNFNSSHGAITSSGGGLMKIKEEPESPTIKNLPATPKSNEPPAQGSDESGESRNEQQRDEEESYPGQESKKFVLAPTPAQLGKAPLQRRLNRGDMPFKCQRIMIFR